MSTDINTPACIPAGLSTQINYTLRGPGILKSYRLPGFAKETDYYKFLL